MVYGLVYFCGLVWFMLSFSRKETPKLGIQGRMWDGLVAIAHGSLLFLSWSLFCFRRQPRAFEFW